MSCRPLLALAFLAAAAASILPGSGARAAAPTTGDAEAVLPRDPADRFGTFANGLHYVVRHNGTPAGNVYLDLAVRTGSLNETAEQNGLAHFLEHMAFKGSTHFPPSKLIPLLTHLGMRFGADTNAHTNQYETVFKLSMPNAEPATMDLALTIFADYANGLGLYPVQIDSERRVILEEVRVRDTLALRLERAANAQLYPGSRMAVHDVLGDPDIIRSAQRPLFADYWDTWYRPENMTLVVVGDVDPAALIARAEPLLGHWVARAPARPAETAGLVPFDTPRAVIVTDPEQVTADVRLTCLRPARPPMTTVAQFRKRLIETIGQGIVDRRLGDWAGRGKRPFQSASVGSGDLLHDGFSVNASAACDPRDWAPAIFGLASEIRRTVDTGFGSAELKVAVDAVRSAAERAVEIEPTRDSSAVVASLSAAVDTDQPILSATQRLRLVEQVLSDLTPEVVRAAFAHDFVTEDYAYVLRVPPARAGWTPPTPDRVLAVARAAWSRPITAPTSAPSAGPTTAPVATLPTDFPPALVASRQTDEKLGLTTVVFDNGVVLHHKFLGTKRDQVLVQVTLPGGLIEETPADRGVSAAAGVAFARPTTGQLSPTQVRDLLAGKAVSVRGGIGLDALSVSINGSPADLPVGLALARALLTDGRVDPAALSGWKRSQLQAVRQRPVRAESQLAQALWETTLGADPRLAPLTVDEILSQRAGPAQAWLRRIADHAAIEVAVVGELSTDDAVALVGRYFGSLPKRAGTFSDLDPLRTVHRPAGPYVASPTYRSAEPKAIVLAGFVGVDATDPDRRPLSLAASILSDRMVRQLRFDQQLVYSISCRSTPASGLPGTGTLAASSTTDPKNADRLAEEIVDDIRQIAADGPTADELATAQKQVANHMAEQLADPGFWLAQTAEMAYRRRPLADLEQLPQAYQSITADQVRNAARRCVSDARLIRLEVRPDGGGGSTRPSAAAATRPTTGALP